MTRHARNCTAGAVYTYHERKKDAASSGYGSKDVRVGKDSQKDFDCCCLTLQPCSNPVLTPDGYLFEKEAILEYIIHQKRENARKMKEYLKQMKKQETTSAADSKNGAKAAGKGEAVAGSSAAGVSNMEGAKAKQLPSFWLPALTPEAGPTLLKKPDEKVRCPMSGKPLKLKDLTDVKWTLIKDGDDKKSLIVKDARYVCAVTNDILGNSVPCALLKTSGNVVTMECVEKIIKKDMIDPTNGKSLTEKDIVPFQRGATAFAVEGIKLQAKKDGPGIMA